MQWLNFKDTINSHRSFNLFAVLFAFGVSIIIGLYAPKNSYLHQEAVVNASFDNGVLTIMQDNHQVVTTNVITLTAAQSIVAQQGTLQPNSYAFSQNSDATTSFYKVTVKYHYGWWSLLPAIIAILISLISRQPVVGLLCGVISGSFILTQYNVVNDSIIDILHSKGSIAVVILYLWLLGGLLGLWAKTGASKATAEYLAKKFVKGPISAKLVTWFLGLLFFQGGTMSAILVGTTVKPLADEHKVSHEEQSYIVDSTASPIAILIPFNAWPFYVQAFLFIPGVEFLATETDRIIFFFKSIPYNFYAIFAVLFTLTLCFNKTLFVGSNMKKALHRARTTGLLDNIDAKPMIAESLTNSVAKGYQPHHREFFISLFALISVAIGSYVMTGSPAIVLAFSIAILSLVVMALVKNMSLSEILDGFSLGLKSIVVASVILLLAIALGGINVELGIGQLLLEKVGTHIPFVLLPAILLIISMTIALVTGSSFGTFAVVFPIVMPFVWLVATQQDMANAEFILLICFAAILNGGVFGDQCSPISDTTILSSLATGADLIDHFKTQIIPAALAMLIACTFWTILLII